MDIRPLVQRRKLHRQLVCDFSQETGSGELLESVVAGVFDEVRLCYRPDQHTEVVARASLVTGSGLGLRHLNLRPQRPWKEEAILMTLHDSGRWSQKELWAPPHSLLMWD